MGLRITCSDYSDFKSVLSTMHLGGDVFAGGPSGTFPIVFIDRGRAVVAQVVGLTTQPASFSTDFPAAVICNAAVTPQFS